MKLIFKYIKPYILAILAVAVLTFVQVQTELSLPDYMSDIVTNGIQYGGITEDVPKAIAKKDMETIVRFMSDKDKEEVLDSYTLLNKGSKAIVGKQEIEFTDDVYYLENESEGLADKMRKPLVYSYLCQSQNIDIDNADIKELTKVLDGSIEGLEDNYSSMAKLYISDLYRNVGLSAEKIQNSYIIDIGKTMLLVSLVGVAVQLLSTYISAKTAAKISAKMRRDVFTKIESFSQAEFSKFSTSSLITRTGNDITKIQNLIQMSMRMLLMSSMMGITAVVKVVRYPQISWILLVAIGIIVGTMAFLLIVAVPKFEIIQKLTDKINSVMREMLDGILVIRAFNAEKQEEKKFDDVNSELTRTDRFVSSAINIMSPVMTIVMNMLTVVIIWFSAKQIDIDAMTIGDMMAFVQYAIHVVMSFMFVTVTFFMIPRSMVSVRRVNEILDTKNSITDTENPVELPEGNGKIVFDDVSFKYPGAEEYVIKNISFEANPGETVAFIGSTGSGKSTIVKLIPRLFDVSEGKITYCGIDIRDIRQKDLHDRIGFAAQRAVMFTGTIRSNIEFGRDISEDKLNEALSISQSLNILDEKENGVDSIITQGGTNVSGGQKQRLSIARALAADKDIYIFDDCFSALDYETDKKLRNELNRMIEKSNATVLIVAQRISTIKNADRIFVINEGKIVGEGTHEELLRSCDVYYEIATSQLSKEELNYARA